MTLPLNLKWQLRFGMKTATAPAFGKLWISADVGVVTGAWNTYVCPFSAKLATADASTGVTGAAVQADPTNYASVGGAPLPPSLVSM